jgi:hypothetical protein
MNGSKQQANQKQQEQDLQQQQERDQQQQQVVQKQQQQQQQQEVKELKEDQQTKERLPVEHHLQRKKVAKGKKEGIVLNKKSLVKNNTIEVNGKEKVQDNEEGDHIVTGSEIRKLDQKQHQQNLVVKGMEDANDNNKKELIKKKNIEMTRSLVNVKEEGKVDVQEINDLHQEQQQQQKSVKGKKDAKVKKEGKKVVEIKQKHQQQQQVKEKDDVDKNEVDKVKGQRHEMIDTEADMEIDEQQGDEVNDDHHHEDTHMSHEESNPDNNHNKKYLPHDYILNDYDVVCGRGRTCYNHKGNIRFRDIVQQQLSSYMDAKTKTDKTMVIYDIIQYVRRTTPTTGGGFVKKDHSTGRFYEVGDFLAVRINNSKIMYLFSLTNFLNAHVSHIQQIFSLFCLVFFLYESNKRKLMTSERKDVSGIP